MLNGPDFLLHAHARAVAAKTRRVQEFGAKAAMPFVVVANRGSEHVATFFPHGRDPMLWVMRLAMGGFGCDLVAGTVDAYTVVADPEASSNAAVINPDTQLPWVQGDMQRAFDRKRPWVMENLVTTSLDKVEQTLRMVGQTYKAKHYKIKWLDLEQLGEGEEVQGLVPSALRRALSAPDVMAHMTRLASDFGMSPLERRAHTDVAALRLCVAQNIPVAYDATDPDVRGIVELSLGDDELNAAMGAPGLHLKHIIAGL